MYLSCDTKKFHDNESTHILHNFWTCTHRGKLPPIPLAAPLLQRHYDVNVMIVNVFGGKIALAMLSVPTATVIMDGIVVGREDIKHRPVTPTLYKYKLSPIDPCDCIVL